MPASSRNAADRRIETTCDYSEPLGAEVLVYFTVAAPAVVTVDVEVDAGAAEGRRAERADDGEVARLVARVSTRSDDHGRQRGRARGRHEPALLLRPGDQARDLATSP